MTMRFREEEIMLDSAGVDYISGEIGAWARAAGIERRNAIRIRVTMEELLLRVSGHTGGGVICRLRMGKRFGTPFIRVRYGGDSYDPTSLAEDELDDWSERLLESVGLSPTWSWRAGRNELMLRAPAAGHSAEFMLLGALALALILGALGSVLPESVTGLLTDFILGPLSEIFLRLLSTFAGLMVFLSIVSGVCGIGNTADLSRIGKTMLTRFLLLSFLGGGVIVLLARPFFSLSGTALTAAGGVSQAGALRDLLLGILPSDPVSPFAGGNTLQIIFLAVVIGMILLLTGERAAHFRDFLLDFNTVILEAVSAVCRLLPIYVFASLTMQFWESGATLLLRLWKPLVLSAALCVILLAGAAIPAGIRLKARPLTLLRICMPAMLIGFTTASSTSAFSTGAEISEKRLGVPRDISGIGIPIGNSLFNSAYPMLYTLIAFHTAEEYGVQVNAVWFVMIWLLSVILSDAAPPVSGGMLACLGIMLTQLGIPAEALAISATLSILLDFICTGTEIGLLHMELAIQADHLGLLRRDILEESAGG